MLRREKIITFAAIAFLLSFILVSVGFSYRHFWIWPTKEMFVLVKQLKGYTKTGRWGLPNQYVPANVRADDPRIRIHNPAEFIPGFRAVLGYDVELELFSVRLINSDGMIVHRWRVDHKALSGRTTFGDAIIPHGMEVFPDGSIIVNFDRFVGVIARIDRCGETMWKRNGIYHHSIHSDGKGGVWTWFSPDDPAGQQQSIVRLKADTGETLFEISLEDLSQRAAENALILGVPDDFVASPSNSIPQNEMSDLFHPNDVEPLTSDLAPHFSMFEEGDLLISLRNLNLVAVLDPDTLLFKWKMHGPWIQQHDPDFTSDGKIEVYDNATGRGRSHIVSADPESGEVTRSFGAESHAFYSPTQGKHQRLPSGSSLVTVPKEGRVIELSPNGELVFEFNNIAGDGTNAAVLNAIWLSEDFFDILPSCQATNPG